MDTTTTTASVTELIKLRIGYLLKRLNGNYKVENAKAWHPKSGIAIDTLKMDKQDRKAVKVELIGYGIIPLRIKVKAKGVSILTDDELFLSNFVVDGKIETSMGTIIGYYCPACCTAVTVRDSYKLFKLEQQTQCMNCLVCNSYEVKPIFSDFVAGPGDMGY